MSTISWLLLIFAFSNFSWAFNDECRAFYQGYDQESTRLTTNVNNWKSSETALGVPDVHQRQVFWGSTPGLPTDEAVAVFHGLYNSPDAMMALTELFTSKSKNTLMSRLAGHRERDANVLKKEIRWQTWLQDAENDFLLATQLGKKIILVGHSTGALLATWLAAKYPEKVSGLILFSPAFGVSRLSRFGATVGKNLNITPVKPGGRVMAGHAGLEVVKAADAFQKWIAENSNDTPDFLERRLSTVPVWMGNTEADIVISQTLARDFMKAIRGSNSETAPREEFWIPYRKFVFHDAITTKSNPELAEIKKSLESFLAKLTSRPVPTQP